VQLAVEAWLTTPYVIQRCINSASSAPLSKQLRGLRRTRSAPRRPADLLNVSSSPSPSRKYSTNRLDCRSSLTLPSPLPIFDNVRYDQKSSPPIALPRLPSCLLPRPTSRARRCSPSYELAREVRDHIYAEALGHPTIIHIFSPTGSKITFCSFYVPTPIADFSRCPTFMYLNHEDLRQYRVGHVAPTCILKD
jgi:hypothetical protein